jgi:hypothetical protein
MANPPNFFFCCLVAVINLLLRRSRRSRTTNWRTTYYWIGMTHWIQNPIHLLPHPSHRRRILPPPFSSCVRRTGVIAHASTPLFRHKVRIFVLVRNVNVVRSNLLRRPLRFGTESVLPFFLSTPMATNDDLMNLSDNISFFLFLNSLGSAELLRASIRVTGKRRPTYKRVVIVDVVGGSHRDRGVFF